jgi:enoyl-CoA hydratase
MTTAPEATKLILTERRDGIFTITINRPAVKNAVNHEVAEQLGAALDTLDADPGLSVGVLTGAGGTFCAGMDLKAFARGERPVLPGRGFGGPTRDTVKKPLVAAVEGWALGGGFELALACDLIVAAENARFGFFEVKRGLVPSEGGLIRLPKRVPYYAATRVLLTGEPIPATAAHQYGLVSELVPPGKALQTARELARRIAQNAPLALSAVKQVLQASQGLDDSEAFARQDELIAGVFSSQDAHEGATAFAEKRPPHWQGR